MDAQPGVSNLAFTPQKSEHGRRRRIIGHGFSEAAIRDSNSIILKHIRVFCDKLLNSGEASEVSSKFDRWTEPIDVTDLSMSCTASALALANQRQLSGCLRISRLISSLGNLTICLRTTQ